MEPRSQGLQSAASRAGWTAGEATHRLGQDTETMSVLRAVACHGMMEEMDREDANQGIHRLTRNHDDDETTSSAGDWLDPD
jgi:hypothetical protein